MCLFRHKWAVVRLSKDSYQVAEICNWCGKKRLRGLLPADEHKHREQMAYEKGRQERIRILNEMRYEMSKKDPVSRDRVSKLRQQLQLSRHAVLEEIRMEKRKRKEADRARIRELQSEIRGLFFGKQ
jgi:hypothetical protein